MNPRMYDVRIETSEQLFRRVRNVRLFSQNNSLMITSVRFTRRAFYLLRNSEILGNVIVLRYRDFFRRSFARLTCSYESY